MEFTDEPEGRETLYVELEMKVESEGPSAPKRIKSGFKEVLTKENATQTKKKQLPKFLEKGLPTPITSKICLLFKRLNINT